jgi:hypothetical protein
MGFLDRLLGRRKVDPLEQQQLTRRVVQAIQHGTPPDEIVGELIEQGIPAREAERLVEVALQVRDSGVHLFGDPE